MFLLLDMTGFVTAFGGCFFGILADCEDIAYGFELGSLLVSPYFCATVPPFIL
jgi:hypothetical protein